MIKRIIRKISDKPWKLKYTKDIQCAYSNSMITGNSINGKKVCISGATGDIGDAMIRRFLLEGCSIILIGRSEEKLQRILNLYNKDNKIQCLKINLMDEQNIIEVYKSFLKNNDIDILINNAGIFNGIQEKKFRTVNEETLMKTLNTNLRSVEILTDLTVKKNIHTKRKLSIINISSICTQFNSFRYSPYGISKSGLLGLTMDLNKKYENSGIISRAIIPGSVATKMGNISLGDNIVGNNNILKRVAIPEEIAAIAAIYASDIGEYCINNLIASAGEVL